MPTGKSNKKKKTVKNFPQGSQSNMKFKNELGSIMAISFTENPGRVEGSYTSGVSDSVTFPLIGYISGNVYSFTVSYTNIGSICTWAGQFIWSESLKTWQIHTLWHLVEPTNPEDEWEDTFAGCDIFTQI